MSSEVRFAIKYQSWRSEEHNSAYLKALEKHTYTLKNYEKSFNPIDESEIKEISVQKKQTLLSNWDESDYVEWSDLQKRRYVEIQEMESKFNDSAEMTFWETIYEEDERYLGVDEEI